MKCRGTHFFPVMIFLCRSFLPGRGLKSTMSSGTLPGLVQESLAIKHTRIPEHLRARQLAVWGHGQLEFSPLKSAGRLLVAHWTSSCHIAMNEFSSSLRASSARWSQTRQRREERTLWATSGKCTGLVQL